MDRKNKLSGVTILLHWFVASVMIIQLVSGFVMAGEVYSLYEIHKSIGVILSAFVVWRIFWRLRNGWPIPLYPNHQALVKWAHGALLFCSVLMLFSGMLYSGASGHGFGLFSFLIFPENHDETGLEVVPFSEFWMDLGLAIHIYAGYFISGLIVLHVLGALKHHFIDHDGTLRRMLGKSV